jgi:putative endonuclease
LYIGITNDLVARLATHNSGKGAKYTRGRTPVVLKACFEFSSRAEASKAEYAFKQLPKSKKLELIRNAPVR